MILVFAPYRQPQESDSEQQRSKLEALRITRWIADQTIAALAPKPIHPLLDTQATASALQSCFPATGLVACSHGTERAILDIHDAISISTDNIANYQAQWGHVIACLTGTELAGQAVHRGWKCYVGYRVCLIVEFDIDTLSQKIRCQFAKLITAITAQLSQNNYDEQRLRYVLNDQIDALLTMIEPDPSDNSQRLSWFVESLLRNMIVGVQE